MRLDGLQLKDFRSYGVADVDFSGVRLASIVGENGAGKSTIMDAALFALTGARTRGGLDSWIRDDQEECQASVIFAANGGRYRATRTRSRRNAGKSTAELAREEGGLWVADCTGAKEMDARIQELLGVDEDLLLMTSFIGQDEAKRFLDLTPGKRLEVVGEILKLDAQYGPLEKHWKAKADEAKAALEEARRDIERHEADVAALETREADLAGAKESLESFRAQMARAEAEITEARERARAAQDDARTAEEAERRLADLRERQRGLQARREALAVEWTSLDMRIATKPGLEEALTGVDILQAELTRLEEAERADAELSQQRAVVAAELEAAKAAMLTTSGQGKPKAAELARLEGQATELNDRVCAIRGAEAPICDRCGQPIGGAALAQTVEQLENELDQVTLRRNELQTEVEGLRAKLAEQKTELHNLEERLAAIPAGTFDLMKYRAVKSELERLETIPAKLAELGALEERRTAVEKDTAEIATQLDDPALAEELTAASAAVAAAEELKRAATTEAQIAKLAEVALETYRRELTDLEKAAARHEEAIALLGPSRDQMKAAHERSRELEEEQADADLLRKAFSKWGIPALIVGNVLLALEREVNDLMALYDSGMTVRFESTKETRDGSRDSLEIIVDRDGISREYSTFSGGEKYRIASCIRLGLALLMAHRSGARIGTLILDEPEGLDAAGRLHLVAILEHLSSQFERVLLISHHDDLKEAMPSQVLVSRGEDGLSQVEVQA